ncbi:AbrB/MazE/SpoVT family DNA-binding domain-containing protein [uncultured Nitrospira sp.]|uniref:AbrB/MazE/SpoVT family DNA-binding domain-containing protein n=1 Tax=uncultured Nitrospira sp. TaxID=157176 RepID=UPI00314026DE
MLDSVITRKGQVTIPKPIRDQLGLEEGEKVIFIRRGDEVLLKVLRGSVLDLKGSVIPSTRPEDFSRIRRAVKKNIGGKAVGRD